jgi:hypothetical protein
VCALPARKMTPGALASAHGQFASARGHARVRNAYFAIAHSRFASTHGQSLMRGAISQLRVRQPVLRSPRSVMLVAWCLSSLARCNTTVGPANDLSLSCTARAHVPKPTRRGGCRQGVAEPRLAICNRRDVTHLVC